MKRCFWVRGSCCCWSTLEEVAQNLSSQMLPPGLLVIHDATAGSQDDVAVRGEKGRRERSIMINTMYLMLLINKFLKCVKLFVSNPLKPNSTVGEVLNGD